MSTTHQTLSGPTERTAPMTGSGGFTSRTAVLSLVFALSALLGCADGGPTDPEALASRTFSPPEAIDDLRVADATDSTLRVAWSQVSTDRGHEAWYELRYAPSSAGAGWSGSEPVESGPCASPIKGQQEDEVVTCTVEELAAGTSYDFQVAAFRRGGDPDSNESLSNVATGTTEEPDTTGTDGSADGDSGSDTTSTDTTSTDTTSTDTTSTVALAGECDDPEPGWIWCDDFDRNRMDAYFEHDDDDGDFVRTSSVGVDGSTAMRNRWSEGEVSAGSLKMAFGRTPQPYFDPVDEGTEDYREIYWRFYVKNEADWTGGGGNKLSRATGFASSSSWAQSMIAHVWTGTSYEDDNLVIDPASGTDEDGNLVTTTYNDFDNLRWLGSDQGSTHLFADDRVGQWYCVEVHVRLNDAGQSNGEFQMWIDGALDAERTGLNWVGDFDDYGINAVFLENYWNEGALQDQERYIDNFVVSTEPIGCPDPS